MKKNPEVDKWFGAKKHPLETAMLRARDIILGADPRVSEMIKWSTPTFAFEGNIVSFNPSKNLVSLMFHRGAEIPGKHPRLEGEGGFVRTMRFADVKEVEARQKDLEAVVRAWCEWKAGAAKKKPTTRERSAARKPRNKNKART